MEGVDGDVVTMERLCKSLMERCKGMMEDVIDGKMEVMMYVAVV